MKQYSLEEKIAQMFLIELQENELTDKTLQLISKYKIGGFLLFRKNYKNYDDMLELVNKLKEANSQNDIPLFISIDQEGGRVNRMPSEFENIRNASKIASTNDIENIRESADIISKMLLQSGVNLNLAPVLDIRRFENENHAIGNRCYGTNKDDVSKYGIEAMKKMQENGMLCAVKHFPGHGATQQDSHFSLPIIRKAKEELENDDMYPFKQAIQNGADAIMMGHILAKNIDRRFPASLSEKIIKQYLIDKYKFKGLIITDDLKMLAIRLKYTRKKAVKLAINAGNNVIMMGYKYTEIVSLIQDIAKEVRKGSIDQKAIDNSFEKIINTKKKYNMSDTKTCGADIEKINDRIIKLNNKLQ